MGYTSKRTGLRYRGWRIHITEGLQPAVTIYDPMYPGRPLHTITGAAAAILLRDARVFVNLVRAYECETVAERFAVA
jgi:hypothetical protein